MSVRLLVNELVTNAFKHGYSDIGGAVSVIARNDCGDIPSRIGQWQGPAARISSDENAGKSLGMKVVRALVQQLEGGASDRKSSTGQGFCHRLPRDA